MEEEKKTTAKRKTATAKKAPEELKPVEEEVKKELPINETPVEEKEAPVEEVKEETVKVVKKEPEQKKGLAAQPTKLPVQPAPAAVKVEDIEEVDDVDAVIEEKRKTFMKVYRKSRIPSFVFIGTSLALIVLCFVFFFTNVNKIATYVCVGVLIAVLIAQVIYGRKTTPKQAKMIRSHIDGVLLVSQAEMFRNVKGVANVNIAPTMKVENDDVINAHLFATINRIDSRATTTGKLNGVNFRSSDVAVTIPVVPTGETPSVGKGGAKKEAYGIFGRYIALDHGIKEGEGIILVCTKGTNTVMPDYLTGYESVEVASLNSAYKVFATSEEVANKYLSGKVLEALNGFEPNLPLYDFIISINDKGTFFAGNYADDYMVVPTGKPVANAKAFANVVLDNEKVFEIFAALE